MARPVEEALNGPSRAEPLTSPVVVRSVDLTGPHFAPPRTSDGSCVLTEPELRERCAYWQRVLRLQDWRVSVQLMRTYGFTKRERSGEVDACREEKRAEIRLIDPVDYEKTHWMDVLDHELTLVHELLHLHFRPFWAEDGTPEDTAQEIAINLIAEALVKLHRGEC